MGFHSLVLIKCLYCVEKHCNNQIHILTECKIINFRAGLISFSMMRTYLHKQEELNFKKGRN